MKSPVLIDVKFDSLRKSDSFSKGIADRAIIDLNDGRVHPDRFPGVKYALVWKPGRALFERLPDLEVLFSAGAGVDHIMKSDFVPDIPIVRFSDPTLTNRMSEWICLQCLLHLRQQRQYDAAQRQTKWQERPQPQASEICVGIMGLGILGLDAAKKLQTLGFKVQGWSRTKKETSAFATYSADELDAFLSSTDFLVGLLPLTPETRGLFNRKVFEKLKKNDEIASPVFINAGRGGSQIEDDIVSCLKDGTLGGVSLDVFESEPLDPKSMLWGFEQAILTPHMAATSDIAALGRHVSRQIERYESNLPLENLVDRNLGY
jgi:glyoxylate/hydroxypyruvate reductase A